MSRSDKPADIDYDSFEHETDDAVLLVIEGKKVWLPKSQVELDEEDKVVTLPEWLAIEKELV